MRARKFHSVEYNPRRKKDKEVMTKYAPDFKKLQIKFDKRIRNNWVGDWDADKNIIKIYRDLDDIDKYGVIIHEFIEMMVTSLMGIPGYPHPDYNQEVHGKRNQMAHDLANETEKRILELANIDWEKHERRINNIRNKKAKK